MKWFRANIKHGARLALLALALQFGLSFGHFHAGAAQAAAPAVESVAAQADISAAPTLSDAADQSAPLPASHDDSDHHPREHCAICAVVAHASSVLFAPRPLPLPQAVDHSYLTTDTAFVHRNAARPAFQPRAPPAS